MGGKCSRAFPFHDPKKHEVLPGWQCWCQGVPQDRALGTLQLLSPCPAVPWALRDTQPPALPGHHTSGEAPFALRGSQPPVIPPGKTTTGSKLLGEKQAALVPALPWQDRDVREGADMLMVKPGMPYLDLVRDVKARVSSWRAGRALGCGLCVPGGAGAPRVCGEGAGGRAGLSPPLTRSRSTPRTRWPCTTSRGSSPCSGTGRRPAPSAWRRRCRRRSPPSGEQVRLRAPVSPPYPRCSPGPAPASRLSAGADIIITYFTPQLLRWLREAQARH